MVAEGVLAGDEPEKFGAGGIVGGGGVEVAFVAEAAGVSTGDEAGAGGGTDGRGDVAVRAEDSGFGEAVEIRCLDRFAAGDAEVAVAHVIGQDEEDVGAVIGRRGEQQEARDEEEGGDVHSGESYVDGEADVARMGEILPAVIRTADVGDCFRLVCGAY